LSFENTLFVSGPLQVIGGGFEAAAGVALGPLGLPIAVHGADNIATGVQKILTNQNKETLTLRVLQSGGSAPLFVGAIETGTKKLLNF